MKGKNKKLILVISLFMVGSVIGYDRDDDDHSKINAHDYEYYQQQQDAGIANKCETDEMSAYGLKVDAQSLSSPNELCPNIK